MKLYKVTLKPLSPLSKIPDAQTIFGSICSIIRFTKGIDELNKYLSSFDNSPIFVHSSMFYEGLLPMAKVGLMSIEEKNKTIFELLKNNDLQQSSKALKKYKSLSYISTDVYKKYIVDGKFKELRKALDENKIQIESDILTDKVNSSGYQLVTHNCKSIVDSEDNESKSLYFDENIYTNRNTCIYVKTDNIDYIESVFKYFPYFGIGNRVSVGKNCFELIRVEELSKQEHHTDYRMLLSKCISNEFILDESNYMIDSVLYRGSKYYYNHITGRINKFVEGSYMKVKEDKDYYGKIIKLDSDKDIYHYGIGFVI